MTLSFPLNMAIFVSILISEPHSPPLAFGNNILHFMEVHGSSIFSGGRFDGDLVVLKPGAQREIKGDIR